MSVLIAAKRPYRPLSVCPTVCAVSISCLSLLLLYLPAASPLGLCCPELCIRAAQWPVPFQMGIRTPACGDFFRKEIPPEGSQSSPFGNMSLPMPPIGMLLARRHSIRYQQGSIREFYLQRDSNRDPMGLCYVSIACRQDRRHHNGRGMYAAALTCARRDRALARHVKRTRKS